MAAPAPPVAAHPLPPLADETLEEFLLRLPTPAALARAATACATFRCVVTQRSFLRRFRKSHPPPLLGLVDDRGDFMPAEAPHPSAQLAEALAAAADFTYSFVPKPAGDNSWRARDVRGGRVLLESSRLRRTIRATSYAVCDPLSRRYVLLPPIPEDMTVQQPPERPAEFEPNLADPAAAGENEDEDVEETCVKVICTARYETKLAAFVFSSVTGEWRVGASFSWAFLATLGPSVRTLHLFNYASGCFCWPSCCMGNLLVLNTRKMEFYLVSYGMRLEEELPGVSTSMPSIFPGTQEAFEIFFLVGHLTSVPTTFYLYHAAQRNNGESSSIECRLKNVTTLPRGYFYFNGGATEGILFLHGKAWDDDLDRPFGDLTAQDFFSLEVKTLELKKVCRGKPCGVPSGRVHSYFGFPPSLSKPSL